MQSHLVLHLFPYRIHPIPFSKVSLKKSLILRNFPNFSLKEYCMRANDIFVFFPTEIAVGSLSGMALELGKEGRYTLKLLICL